MRSLGPQFGLSRLHFVIVVSSRSDIAQVYTSYKMQTTNIQNSERELETMSWTMSLTVHVLCVLRVILLKAFAAYMSLEWVYIIL